MKHKCWLKAVAQVTPPATETWHERVKRDRQLLAMRKNYPERMSEFDRHIFEAKLYAACDTALKRDYVNGKIHLKRYLMKENK